jgi:tRNA A-37 threonylcarbamoyl transferase component Bud32
MPEESNPLSELEIIGVGKPIAVGLQSATLPIEVKEGSSGFVVKDFDVEKYSEMGIISTRSPQQKAHDSYLMLHALKEKGVPVPPVSELVIDDAYESVGIQRGTLIQTDIRQFGKVINLYTNPGIIYNYKNKKEIMEGIGSDLAKMHSIGLVVDRNLLTPWVVLDNNSRKLERMVLDAAGFNQNPHDYRTDCFSNFQFIKNLFEGKYAEHFLKTYLDNLEFDGLKQAVVEHMEKV